jgi:hypothetical protein
MRVCGTTGVGERQVFRIGKTSRIAFKEVSNLSTPAAMLEEGFGNENEQWFKLLPGGA